ncbi:hypothetical protein CRUP_025766 [Coryphaenoides rupestris]|nr:hypothetical protein CRUP_025766 [Coryphaenoides rupestris]
MANTVLGVGTGVFLIVLLWILALIFGIILLRASGPIKLGVIPVFLVALIVTLALVLFPRTSATSPPFKEAQPTQEHCDEPTAWPLPPRLEDTRLICAIMMSDGVVFKTWRNMSMARCPTVLYMSRLDYTSRHA